MRRRAVFYPVFLADPAGVLQVPGPGQAQGAHLEVAVGEHVGEAEGVVVFLWAHNVV